MMKLFFGYILLGLTLGAPIGPVNAAQLDHGIKHGFFHSWLVGLGAMIADGVFMLFIFFGVVHFLEIPFMQTFLWIFGAFVLIYTGIESIISSRKIQTRNERNKDTTWKSFFTGFFISILNPLSILFWLGIYGSILTTTMNQFGKDELLLYSGAIFIGLFLWDLTMATVSSIFRNYFATRFLVYISIISGVFLIAFGIFFGLQGIKALI